MTTRKTNTETQSRVCPLCNETVPAFAVVPSRGYGASDGTRRVAVLREAHAVQCKGVVPAEVAADALVLADAFVVADGKESVLRTWKSIAEIITPRPLAWWRDLARAIYEKKFPAQARVNEIAEATEARSPEELKRHDTEAARGWLTLQKGIGTRYTCRYCRVEIVESIGSSPGNEIVAEALADKHATLCALHVIGGMREPVLSAPRFPDPERPDYK